MTSPESMNMLTESMNDGTTKQWGAKELLGLVFVLGQLILILLVLHELDVLPRTFAG